MAFFLGAVWTRLLGYLPNPELRLDVKRAGYSSMGDCRCAWPMAWTPLFGLISQQQPFIAFFLELASWRKTGIPSRDFIEEVLVDGE